MKVVKTGAGQKGGPGPDHCGIVQTVLAVSLCLLRMILAVVPAHSQTAYTLDGPAAGQTLWEWDLPSGDIEAVGALDPNPEVFALAFSPTGVLYGGGRDPHQLVTIDPGTGETTVVGPFGLEVKASDLTFDACGRLWMVAFVEEDPGIPGDEVPGLYSVDPDTGAATAIDPDLGEFIGIAAIGETLYGATSWFFPANPTPSSLFEVDPSTGELTFLTGLEPQMTIFTGPRLDFDSGGQLWALHQLPHVPDLPSAASSIDPNSGFVTTASQCNILSTCIGFAIAAPIGECLSREVIEVPALSRPGLAMLAAALALAALGLLRCRRPSWC